MYYFVLGEISFYAWYLTDDLQDLTGRLMKKRSVFPYHAEAMEVLQRIKHLRSYEEPSQISGLFAVTSSVQGFTQLSW